MKGCKVERSKFIRLDTIWRILETHLFKLIRVDAFYTISDPKLFKMYTEIDPKLLRGTSKWSHWRSKCFRWSQVDPGVLRCAQREVQVRQDGCKRCPKELLGIPRRAQRDAREPKRA